MPKARAKLSTVATSTEAALGSLMGTLLGQVLGFRFMFAYSRATNLKLFASPVHVLTVANRRYLVGVSLGLQGTVRLGCGRQLRQATD